MEKEEKYLGIVSNYFDHVSVAAIKLDSELKVGDKIRFIGGETDFKQSVETIQIQRKDVKSAKKGDEVGVRVKEKVRKGYKVYKI